MKIAFSASYFNCPPVREILNTCDKIYTTHQFAVVKLATLPIELTTGSNIEAMMRSHPRENSVTYSDLFMIFNAVYTGNAVPIGFHNASLGQAIIYRPTSGDGKNFEAFVIPKETKSFRFISSNDEDIAHILKWCRSHIVWIMSVDEVVDEVYHRCCVGGGDLTTKFLARNSPRQDLWDYVCAKDLLRQPLF